MIISDMLKNPTLPENLQTLSEDLEKLLTLVNDATTFIHLDCAERHLRFFTRKWQLESDGHPNPILGAIGEKICLKRNAKIVEDENNANASRIKTAA